MKTTPTCTIDCSDYLWKAQKLDSRADEAFTYLHELIREGLECQVATERKFASRLRASAQELWDHLYTFHPEDLKSLNEY